jgi:hypothetical protein
MLKILLIFLPFALIVGAIFYFISSQDSKIFNSSGKRSTQSYSNWTTKDAKESGQNLSYNRCQGMEIKKLGALPMRYEDFAMIIPYGLVVGDHVTPIDHQYFSPTIFHSPRDTYEVYAMADSTLVSIEPRVKPDYTEYRLVFSISCRLFYYYDLVTSLTPELKDEYDKKSRDVNIPVKEGQLIGRIGGQTLDFAVWDTEKILTGFVDPNNYQEERWKIHTVDPLDYYTEGLKNLALSKYLRTTPPSSGKIDYDIDGRLIGNWFLEGTDGYRGTKAQGVQNYSQTHLAIVPNHLDPSFYMASFGNFNNQFKQFVIKEATPDPKKVGIESGVVKYELSDFQYTKKDGGPWDYTSFTQDPKIKPATPVGCVLYQLITNRKLKVETFPSQSCNQISGFSSKALTYYR